MNREDIIRMAREAGFMLRAEPIDGESDWWECFDEEIERFAQLVVAEEREHLLKVWHNAVAAEREACAKLVESLWNTPCNGMATEESVYADVCAKAIRYRSHQ